MWVRDGVDVHGGFVSSVHEGYRSGGSDQGFLNARISFRADGCTGLACAIVRQLGLVALVPRSEIIFQRVHVRRKFGDLAEYYSQVYGDDER